jgi:hypothetical protein
MQQLFDIFPFITKINTALESQNKLLYRVMLTGKISALDVAANLFEYTERTAESFLLLQKNLIENLLIENRNKLFNETHAKAQVAIDILIRNLFERTADVGFLATDEVIIDFLKNECYSLEQIRERLKEYVLKYSVYNEIVIFDTLGHCRANLDASNTLKQSNDPLIKEALESDNFCEAYRKSDIYIQQNKTLIYAQKIVDNNETLGVLCLCFKFDDEMQTILSKLTTKDEVIVLSDTHNDILASNKKIHTIDALSSQKLNQYSVKNSRFNVTVKTQGYQGYEGQEWFSSVSYPSQSAHAVNISDDENRSLKTFSASNERLAQLVEQARDIMEDLADVIINGELIAAKGRFYVLTPILDNLRQISFNVFKLIELSVRNLEETLAEATEHRAIFTAQLMIDIMDRNLYERANDCRWWALTPTFIEALSSETPNTQLLNQKLAYINELYTVYTDIFIYDTTSTIIACSNTESFIGQKIDKNLTQYSTQSQEYFVSEFAQSPFYGAKPTYIYYASIVKEKKVVGGIGIVFDAEVEFKAILDDCVSEDENDFALFIDAKKCVISSTSSHYAPLDILDIPDDFLHVNHDHNNLETINIDDIEYKVGISKSIGYREYKVSDHYKNDVYAVTFSKI